MVFLSAVIAFLIGAGVAVWLNVCVERLPWEQSPFWPAQMVPNSFKPVPKVIWVPLIGWFLVRFAKLEPIPVRWLVLQFITGLLFASVIWIRPEASWGVHIYGMILVAVLLTATFTDIDYQVIPSPITDVGIVLGLIGAAIVPSARFAPEAATSAWPGLVAAIVGLVVGAGIVLVTRVLGALLFRREAMGSGDVGLMAVIGAFLGWRIAILTFFLAAFIGLFHAGFKLIVVIVKLALSRKILASDREIFFGPYLCSAAWILALFWPNLWNGYAKTVFESLSFLFWHYIMGYDSVL